MVEPSIMATFADSDAADINKEKKHSTWMQKSVQRKLSMDALPTKLRTTPFDPYVFPLDEKCPEIVPVFIEVAAGSRNKYEWNQEHGVMMLDRVLHSAVFYPENYGFIPQTLCGDGDPLDVLVMGSNQPLIPGCIVNARPICHMIMEDEKGMDEKVLAVLANDAAFYHIKSMKDLGEHKLAEVSNFFETYKKLEKDKWAKVGGWQDTAETYQLIRDTHETFLKEEQVLENEL